MGHGENPEHGHTEQGQHGKIQWQHGQRASWCLSIRLVSFSMRQVGSHSAQWCVDGDDLQARKQPDGPISPLAGAVVRGTRTRPPRDRLRSTTRSPMGVRRSHLERGLGESGTARCQLPAPAPCAIDPSSVPRSYPRRQCSSGLPCIHPSIHPGGVCGCEPSSLGNRGPHRNQPLATAHSNTPTPLLLVEITQRMPYPLPTRRRPTPGSSRPG